MSAVERGLPERVAKVETTVEAVVKGIEEIKEEIRGFRQEMNSWLRWILGIIFSSWLTLMVSIWLKK